MNARTKTLTAVAMCLALLGILVLSSVGDAEQSAPAPQGAQTASGLAIFPPDINLETARDTQSIVAKFTQPDGVTRDVTGQCKFELANPALAKMDGRALKPLADGTTEMTVTYNGESRKLPVTVKDAKVDRPISFKLDVMPVFLRAGCNTGGCHG
ncbi:MAG: hypothetical protein JWN40_2920, partial [Phycisphaerales bacterium]|nr:hypothetical protein [Phycisphaerales bacterium]